MNPRPNRARLLPWLAFPLLTPLAHGQKIFDIVFGTTNQESLGSALAFIGDIDGDGNDEVICGVDSATPNPLVRVYSGADRSVLMEIVLADPSSSFGAAVAGAGDVNDDNVPDFIVGAPSEGPGGVARVYSGADGSVLHLIPGPATNGDFGISVAGLGDLDGDGHDDFAVGDRDDNSGPNQTSGSATVFSGDTGAILFKKYGDSHVDAFGEDIAAAGDLDGDGTGDLIVGAPWDDPGVNNGGVAWAFSGATGALLFTDGGAGAGDFYGEVVAAAGDVNNDGFDDVLVGTGHANYTRVLSGQGGTLLYEITGSTAFFGPDCVGVGDFDNDNFDDFAIGDPLATAPRDEVVIYSGRTGAELWRIYVDENDTGFGRVLASGGDLDNNGRIDLVIGNPGDDDVIGNGGSIWFIGVMAPMGTNYCGPAVLNSDGLSGKITAYGSDVASDVCLTLWVSDIPTNEFGFFVTSMTQGFVQPPSSSGNLCLGGEIGRFNRAEEIFRGPLAAIEIDLSDLPIVGGGPVLAGETWNYQAWYRDGNTNNFTDAVSITFQ